MTKYEVHWLEYYTTDHLNGEWDDCLEVFKTKRAAIDKAMWLKKMGTKSIKVYKIIDWNEESNEQAIR